MRQCRFTEAQIVEMNKDKKLEFRQLRFAVEMASVLRRSPLFTANAVWRNIQMGIRALSKCKNNRLIKI